MFLLIIKLDFLSKSLLEVHTVLHCKGVNSRYPASILSTLVTLARGLCLSRLTLSKGLLLCEFRLLRQRLGKQHKSVHIPFLFVHHLRMTDRPDRQYPW